MIDWFNNKFDKSAIAKIGECFENRSLSMGPQCGRLEEEIAGYTGSRFCVVTTSGSVALLMIALSLDLAGYEAIVQSRTWIATPHAFKLAGMRVKVVDVLPSGSGFNLEELKSHISKRTKVIVATHMNGNLSNASQLRSFCDEHGILLIEDAAQALGSTQDQKMAGTYGLAGVYSFSVPKIISGGQGGAIVTDCPELHLRLRNFLTHGLSSLVEISDWHWPGFNFRYNDVQASIVLTELQSIQSRIEHLRNIQYFYRAKLSDLPIEFLPYPLGQVGPYVEVIAHGRRDNLHKYLFDKNIITRKFYPSISKASYIISNACPNGETMATHGLYLPSGPSSSLEQLEEVVVEIRSFYENS